MGYRLQIGEQFINIIDGEISQRLEEITTFNLSVLKQDIDPETIVGQDVIIYFNQFELTRGFITQKPQFSYDSDRSLVIAELEGMEELGKLANQFPRYGVIAENGNNFPYHTLAQILSESGWTLVSLGNFEQLDGAYYSDRYFQNLHNADSVFAQIKNYFDAYPGYQYYVDNKNKTFYLYNQNLLPINFRTVNVSGTYNLLELQEENTNSEYVTSVYPIGGSSKFNFLWRVKQGHADGQLDGTYASPNNPDVQRYRIGSDDDNEFFNYVYDSEASDYNTLQKYKKFSDVSTENDLSSSSPNNINRYGISMYQKAIKYLQKNGVQKIYTGRFFAPLPIMNVGEYINIRFSKIELNNTFPVSIRQQENVANIKGKYKITELTHQFNDIVYDDVSGNYMLIYDFKTSENGYATNIDSYEMEIQEPESRDKLSNPFQRATGQHQILNYSSVPESNSANASFNQNGVVDAYEISISSGFPSMVSVGAITNNLIATTIIINNPNEYRDIRQTSKLTYDSAFNTLSFVVRPRNHSWGDKTNKSFDFSIAYSYYGYDWS